MDNRAKYERLLADAQKGDSAKGARRRKRDTRVISQMIAMHCEGVHGEHEKTSTSYSGDAICDSCAILDDYAVSRTISCRNIENKVTCEECENQCYQPEMRERIREAMRWSGPRMATRHPISAIRHLFGW